MNNKKILIITNVSGGLYGFRRELISELVKTNNVYAATTLTIKTDELEQLGVRLIDVPVESRSVNPIKDFVLLIKYVKLIKSLKPDLVITYTIMPNLYGGIASRICRNTYAANITGLGTAFQKNGLLKMGIIKLYKFALKKAKTVFFENAGNRDFFVNQNIIEQKQSCLLSGAGVNTDYYQYHHYPHNDPFIFLFMGRVMKEKGINELFDAMKILIDQGNNCILKVLGGYEEDYKNVIQKHSSEGWLYYYGYQDDVIPFIQEANCFVLPSWHEGMANTNLECASVGRPIITSNISGCKEAVIDGVSGFLCEPKNYKSLCEKMEMMINLSDDERMIMGMEGRRHMETSFDKKIVVEETIKNL